MEELPEAAEAIGDEERTGAHLGAVGSLHVFSGSATLAEQARLQRLAFIENDGCFSATSLGQLGGTAFTLTINAPEIAVLGIGCAAQKMVDVDGSIARNYDGRLCLRRSDVLAPEENMTLHLRSPAFADGTPIPGKYTCEGADMSPPLAWSGVRDSAKSLVLIVDDPDAPDPRAPKMVWVHWVVYNLPPDAAGLPEGAKVLPKNAKAGLNDWKRTDYGGPCPPVGRHRYFHKLYALDVMLPDLGQPTKSKVEAAR